MKDTALGEGLVTNIAYPTAKIFLGGDFNSPGINWSDGTLSESYVSLCIFQREAHCSY